MAVYTKVSHDDIIAFLADYDLGEFVALTGIKAGVSNSNYILDTTRQRVILTIYEDRTPAEDLPFFLSLMGHIAQKGVPVPLPIHGKDGLALRHLHGKPAALTTFLRGSVPSRVGVEECGHAGRGLAGLHTATQDFSTSRVNNLALCGWEKLFEPCLDRADRLKAGLASAIQQEMAFLKRNWPTELPAGIIHADLFPDNTLFDAHGLCGMIDFYFACHDDYAYDVAIALNAWCFEPNNISFNLTKARALIEGYCSVRPLSERERAALPILCRGASMRFMATRLYDWLHQTEGALVKAKDPLDYLYRLQFHQHARDVSAYGVR